MTDKFRFNHDAARRFVSVELLGVWTQADLVAFSQKAAGIIAAESATTKEARVLIDLSTFPVQPKDVAGALGEMMPLFGARVGRVAVIRSHSTLQHLQTQRVLVSDVMQTFETVDEGMAWLFDRDAVITVGTV